ncbi:hypothetical protein Tco_1157825 [Tanacetum coccineum]
MSTPLAFHLPLVVTLQQGQRDVVPLKKKSRQAIKDELHLYLGGLSESVRDIPLEVFRESMSTSRRNVDVREFSSRHVGESSSRGVGAYETRSRVAGALKEKTKGKITPSKSIRRRRSVVERN